MATKSPQQFHGSWPSAATFADLPNSAAAAVQDAALEVGDTCLVAADKEVYVCDDATLGAAVWLKEVDGRPGGRTIQGGSAAGEHLDFESTSDPTKGDIRILAGERLVVQDSAARHGLNVTPRNAPPAGAAVNDQYLDDGTNTASGSVGWRICTSIGPAVWADVSAVGSQTVACASSFSSQGIGAGTYYADGFYRAPVGAKIATQASPVQVYGTAGVSYAARAFVVCGGAGGVVGGGTVALRVSGTSITDAGVRTPGDTEFIIADITAVALNEYYQTTKKWVGQISFTLVITAGAPGVYNLNFNYGFARYQDVLGVDHTIICFEGTGLAGASDANFNVELLHHKATGWTYNIGAFVPGSAPAIFNLQTVHAGDDNLQNNEPFSFKRSGLAVAVAGSAGEGFIIRVTTSLNNSVEIVDFHVAVTF